MPKISIIIPVYNVEKYLCECLESIINQTFKDIEIICINDGSTDKSLDILNEYAAKDERFVIINGQNEGCSVSRNKGISIAKGDYITFMDSDDYFLNNDYLEKLQNAAEKYDADIAVASIKRGDDKKSVFLLNIESENVYTDYLQKLKACDCPDSCYVWNKLYKKNSLIDAGIKFPQGQLYEDVSFTYKILYYTGKLVTVPGVTYFYRKSKGSIIKQKSKKAKSDFENARKDMLNFFKTNNIDINAISSVVKRHKLFGFTIFKTVTKNQKRKSILFNTIEWETLLKG